MCSYTVGSRVSCGHNPKLYAHSFELVQAAKRTVTYTVKPHLVDTPEIRTSTKKGTLKACLHWQFKTGLMLIESRSIVSALDPHSAKVNRKYSRSELDWAIHVP